MSTHQASKPRAAKKSMAENSLRPGTCRSKVGCEAIEEPCTNRIVPRVLAGSAAHLFHRNSLTAPFSRVVQCSVPVRRSCSFMPLFPVLLDLDAVGVDDLGPAIDLGLHEGAELGGL